MPNELKPLATTAHLNDASADMETTLSYIWQQIESDRIRVTTATMLLIREALIRAGHDELKLEPVRHIRIAGVE